MADESKQPQAAPAPAKSDPPPRRLSPAGESTDPTVQQIHAERALAQQNQADRQRDKEAADKQAASDQKVIDEKTAQLRELGYA